MRARRPREGSSAMTSSSSSSSSLQIIDPVPPHAADTTTVETRDSDSDYDGGGGGGESSPSWPAVERIASSYRTQKSLDALCRKYGVDTEQFAPLLAGDRRACSPPPAGEVCVYADALVAGMRVPLQPFFCEVLSHFGLAPSQLAPNSWRFMVAFAALSRSAGAHPPSVAVFRHFFRLRGLKKIKGLYYFAGKPDTTGALFTGKPDYNQKWRERFFFLRSKEPWPCPVLWGEPTKKSTADPMLTSEHKGMVEKLLRKRGAAPIDIRTWLSDHVNLAAATTTIPSAPKPPPHRHTIDTNGIYALMQNIRAEKAAAAANTPSTGKKRKLGQGPSAGQEAASAPPRFSMSMATNCALELEEKLAAREREVDALRRELAEAREEARSAGAAAVREYLDSTDHAVRRTQDALHGHKKGVEAMKQAVMRRFPHLDPDELDKLVETLVGAGP